MNNISFESLDFIYHVIRVNNSIDKESIKKKYKTELSSLKFNRGYLEHILSKLIEDQKIYEPTPNEFVIIPQSEEFIGYLAEKYKIRKREKHNNNFKKYTVLLPIILAFIFGSISSILGYSNFKNHNNINKMSMQIDSLNHEVVKKDMQIVNLNDTLKSFKAIKNHPLAENDF